MKISPSSLHRLMNCTGSAMLSESIVESVNPYALAGIRAHQVVLSSVELGSADHVFDQMDPIQETIEQAEIYKQHAQEILDVVGKKARFVQAERFMPSLEVLGMEKSGREGEWQADLIWKVGDVWHVLDYKTGKTPVEPTIQNHQLLAYAWALLWELKDDSIDAVELHIYQPAVGRNDSARATTTHLLRMWQPEVEHVITAAKAGGNLNSGAWCVWCPARKNCPKIQGTSDARKDKNDMTKAQGLLALAAVPQTLEKLPAVGADVAIPAEAIKRAAEIKNSAEELAEAKITDQAMADIGSDILKQATVFEKQLDDLRALTKAPYLEAGKAVDLAFKPVIAELADAKKLVKSSIESYLQEIERKRQTEIAEAKAKQDKLDAELRAAEEAAAQAKGKAAKAEAEKKMKELAQKAAEASIVAPPAEAPKIAGVKGKTVYAFKIPDIAVIPERYLVKASPALEAEGTGLIVLVSLDLKTLTSDYAAGRLKGASWLSVTEKTVVSSGR